jgi:flagellar biosynthesis/type III secretory pathway M-ring protein FliF/YscJ
MATTSEGTIDVTTTTTQPTSTTEISSTQAATTLSSDEFTSAEIDTTTIKDDDISTIAQISAQSKGSVDLKTIIGVIIAVVLLIVAGLIVAIIVAIIIKKRGKSIGGYSLPDKKPQSTGTANGVGKSSDPCCFSAPHGPFISRQPHI